MTLDNRKKIIVVNATALVSGGALTILEYFVRDIKDTKHVYYIFVSLLLKEAFPASENIKFIGIDTASFAKRIWWDWVGLNNWLQENNIKPYLVFSLQNTSVNTNKGIKQVIYLHQALTFHEKNWSLLKREERKFFFYKHIYPLFIRAFMQRDTRFIVQTEWMKQAVIKKFKTKNVKVLPPYNNQLVPALIPQINLNFKYTLFYPASAEVFKNHIRLIHALAAIKREYPNISLGLYLTIKKYENAKLAPLIQRLKLENNIVFLGTISKKQVYMYYKSVNCVVFPSFIESFGLPLLEAQQYIKPLVVSDEEYAREVMQNYPHVIFAKTHSTEDWKNSILKALVLSGQLRGQQYQLPIAKNNFESALF